jgi:hypothetical protein
MSRTLLTAAFLCALAILASRAPADVPQKATEEPKTPIWEQQPNLTLDSKDEAKPLLLADSPSDLGKADYSDNWRFRTYTTLWIANITGTVGRGDYEADLDIGFDDIIDKATVITLNFEFGKGPWSVILFGLWMNIEDDVTTPSGFDGDFEGNFAFLDASFAYHITDFSVGGDSKVYLEGLIGLRWTYIDTSFDINEGPLAGTSRDRDKNFVDPTIGARARYYINNDWNLTLMGTIGGFGVSSDLIAGGDLMVEWRFSDRWSAVAGYRAVYYDYSDNFEWNVTIHGPYIGISTRW